MVAYLLVFWFSNGGVKLLLESHKSRSVFRLLTPAVKHSAVQLFWAPNRAWQAIAFQESISYLSVCHVGVRMLAVCDDFVKNDSK